ncbi:hypothetical protein VKT23_000257 [Stygiomarasmius scandens]|uniref:Uncharacterized protein n=1 Tax=Marasmiellus scandens TaxID=2682957 RepID=A0ABR1K633_9AGAR
MVDWSLLVQLNRPGMSGGERESTQQWRRRAHAAVLSLLPNLKRRLPSSRFAQALGLAARELTTRRCRHPLYSPSRRNGVYIPSGALTSLASPPRHRSARLSGIPPSPSVSQIDVSSISSSSPSPLDGDDEIISSGIGSVSAGPSRRRSTRLSALHTTQTLSGITSSASSACLSGWQYHG